MSEDKPNASGSEQTARTHTPQGFLRAVHIPAADLEKIMLLIEDGMRPGSATRKYGTSYTQFVRRIDKEPDLQARWQKVQERHRADLQSEHGKDDHDDPARVSQSGVSD